MNEVDKKRRARLRRKRHVRAALFGTSEKPRLSVYRSLKNIGCQIIDDSAGFTLASSSTQLPQIRGQASCGGNVAAAALVGKDIAEKARAKNIEMVIFDRGPYKYHGRVKALAEGAREVGLKF